MNTAAGFHFVRCLVVIALFLIQAARGAFVPMPLTPESFNQDIVVEKGALAPLMPVTTASLDAGLGNDGYSFYERGYHLDAPATGLPKAGSVISSDLTADHAFQFAPTYTTNNAFLIDSNNLSGTLVLDSPGAFSSLSSLTAGGNGGGSIGYTIHHQDGTTQAGAVPCPSWNSLNPGAFAANGKVHVRSFVTSGVNGTYPKLFSSDITVSNTASPVVTVELNYIGGAGHNAVLALSGASAPGAAFEPITVSGYNQDIVVEATGPHPSFLLGATTATMDDGSANTRTTWYEQGYYPGDLASGLPPAGSTVVSAAAPDHAYVLPGSYGANNACMVDPASPSASLTPTMAVAVSALSFLTASGNGPVTLRAVAQHADGTGETNLLIVPDWNSGGTDAFHANGRVSTSTRLVMPASGSPSLYAIDVQLTNTSPVTNVRVGFKSGGASSHAAVFALSGAKVSTERPVLSIAPDGAGGMVIRTTAPGRLESATALNGTNTVWEEEGRLESELQLTPKAGEPARYYRLAP